MYSETMLVEYIGLVTVFLHALFGRTTVTINFKQVFSIPSGNFQKTFTKLAIRLLLSRCMAPPPIYRRPSRIFNVPE